MSQRKKILTVLAVYFLEAFSTNNDTIMIATFVALAVGETRHQFFWQKIIAGVSYFWVKLASEIFS